MVSKYTTSFVHKNYKSLVCGIVVFAHYQTSLHNSAAICVIHRLNDKKTWCIQTDKSKGMYLGGIKIMLC